jgi:hypothetical protein
MPGIPKIKDGAFMRRMSAAGRLKTAATHTISKN